MPKNTFSLLHVVLCFYLKFACIDLIVPLSGRAELAQKEKEREERIRRIKEMQEEERRKKLEELKQHVS